MVLKERTYGQRRIRKIFLFLPTKVRIGEDRLTLWLESIEVTEQWTPSLPFGDGDFWSTVSVRRLNSNEGGELTLLPSDEE